MATSIFLPNQCLTLLSNTNPKYPSPKTITSFLPRSSHSQLFGLKLSASTTSAGSTLTPGSNSAICRPPICAKVSKGDTPPGFTLKNQDGRDVSLSSFKGKPLVLYFYPADESPGCTKEACAFRDSYDTFKKAGAEVVGISVDSPASHKSFAKKYRLPFVLLSDDNNQVRKQWGVPSDLFGTLPGRQTYVMDKKGVVQLIYNNQFQPEKHIDETLSLLRTL